MIGSANVSQMRTLVVIAHEDAGDCTSFPGFFSINFSKNASPFNSPFGSNHYIGNDFVFVSKRFRDSSRFAIQLFMHNLGKGTTIPWSRSRKSRWRTAKERSNLVMVCVKRSTFVNYNCLPISQLIFTIWKAELLYFWCMDECMDLLLNCDF